MTFPDEFLAPLRYYQERIDAVPLASLERR